MLNNELLVTVFIRKDGNIYIFLFRQKQKRKTLTRNAHRSLVYHRFDHKDKAKDCKSSVYIVFVLGSRVREMEFQFFL